MIGKKVGDVFTLSSGGIQDRTAEILSIDSKYVHRFQECLNQFQVRFPDRGDLQQVRLARQHNSDNQQLDISRILEILWTSTTTMLCKRWAFIVPNQHHLTFWLTPNCADLFQTMSLAD